MRAPLGRSEIVAMLADAGRHPSRALGQNFVVDPNTVTRIARLAGVGEGDHVVEVGAGLGSLTLALAATGASVVAVEIDGHLVPLLRAVVEPEGVVVVEGDALRLEWSAVLAGGASWVLVANLPYNVATPLVATILEQVPQVDRMLVMVQREVGERLVAGPGGKARGAVSVKVEWFASAAIAGSVSREVFLPRPNVDSVLVAIKRRPSLLEAVPYEDVMSLVQMGFGKRRKMLRSALAGVVSPEVFAAADVAPEARAEMLDLEAWGRLAQCRRSLGSSRTPS